jgi:AraC-like DNA-binding protein
MALLIYSLQEISKAEQTVTEKAIAFMKKNISNRYTLQELAVFFNYSPSQFSNKFRKETGYSPIDYFIHLKLQQACKLLDSTDKKIYEIADELGYDDPYYFSKLFKKVMHVAPEQYKLSKKG